MEPAKADREYPLGEIIIKTGKESQEDMADTRTDELYRALQDKGYPDELCREIAYKHMNTDYTATRMLGYLYRVTSPRVEDVIDEMLAILSDREAIVRKKELEHAQSFASAGGSEASSFKENQEIMALEHHLLPQKFIIDNYINMNAHFNFIRFF